MVLRRDCNLAHSLGTVPLVRSRKRTLSAMQSEECEDEDGGGALSALEPTMKRIRLCADTHSTAVALNVAL